MTALVAVRALHFALAIQAVGAVLFVWIVGRAAASAARADQHVQRLLLRIAVVAAAGAILSGIAWLVLQAADMTEVGVVEAWTSGAVGGLLFKTQAGVIWWVRLALAATLLVDVGMLALAARAPSPTAVAFAFLLAAATFVSGAWLGHAGADPSALRPLHLAVHAAHMFGVSLWVGGLLPLAVLLGRAPGADAAVVAARASVWFGNIALAAVILILATGLALAALAVESPAELTTGPFGRLLGAKIVLVLAMLVLAARNRWQLVPLLAAAKDPANATLPLSRSVMGELALAALVLVIAGALGITPPGASEG